MPDASTRIGSLLELRRYPVKSMGGESIRASRLAPGLGLAGDRAWALRDVAAGEIRGAKQLPALLECSARYLEEPCGAESAPIEIDLGALGRTRSGEPEVSARISRRIGRDVQLCARAPAGDAAHYRRAAPIRDMASALREGSALLPDEALPPLRDLPAGLSILSEYVSPPGSYFDFFDVHLLSLRSLASLAARAPGSRIDARRFRPNLLVALELPGDPRADWPETALVGRTLAIGEAELEVVMPMLRCVMTTHAQRELPKDPGIMRTLVRECEMSLGVGVQVRRPGVVRSGDEIQLRKR